HLPAGHSGRDRDPFGSLGRPTATDPHGATRGRPQSAHLREGAHVGAAGVINTVARLSLVLVVLLTLQTTVLAEPIIGARADLMLLFAIAVGLTAGAERGAIFGFIAGFLLDLVVHGTPVGFFALGFTVVGYMTGVLHHAVLRTAWWIPV